MKDSIIFLDNELIPTDDQLVRRLMPGVLKARGVFETMRVYPTGKEGRKGKIFGLQEHFSRLKRGLKILQLESPLSQKQMQEALERVLELNHFTSARVRFIIWQDDTVKKIIDANGQRVLPLRTLPVLVPARGKRTPCASPAGAEINVTGQDDHREKVHAAIMAFAYDPFPAAQYRKGFKAIVSKTKLAAVSLLKEVKSLDYVPFLQAYRWAKARGYDETLLLNHRGEVVEGSRSNIFFLKDGKLCTPALASGCLKGITRGAVIKIAQQMGIKVKQVRTVPQEFLNAREAFLTNSLIEVMPLTSIEGRSVGNGKAGPVTLRILKEYRSVVSKS